MFQFAKQPQTFWLIIKDSFRLWAMSAWKWWYIVAALLILASLPLFWVSATVSSALPLLKFMQELAPSMTFFYLISIFTFTIFITLCSKFAENIKQNVWQALGHGLARYPSCLITFVLYGIIVILGSALAIIPGLIFAVYFCVSMPLVVTENLGPFKALKKSYNLVSGHWPHVFLVNLIVLFVVYSFMLLCILAFNSMLLRNTLAVFFSVLFLPLVWSTLIVLIRDLELRQTTEPKPIGG